MGAFGVLSSILLKRPGNIYKYNGCLPQGKNVWLSLKERQTRPDFGEIQAWLKVMRWGTVLYGYWPNDCWVTDVLKPQSPPYDAGTVLALEVIVRILLLGHSVKPYLNACTWYERSESPGGYYCAIPGPSVLIIKCLLSTHLPGLCSLRWGVSTSRLWFWVRHHKPMLLSAERSPLCPYFFIVKMEMTVAPLSWAAGWIDCSGWQELSMVPSMHKGRYEAGIVIISFWPTGSSVLVWINSITVISFQCVAGTWTEGPEVLVGKCWCGRAGEGDFER